MDFNSDNWKDKLKGKSPEEIAKIVGDYYEEQYKDIHEFDKRKIITWVICLIIFIAIIVIVLFYLKSLSSNI